MCGIVGYIGNSTDPAATFDLVNQLMIKTEPRGLDATGFWATTGKGDNRVIYHKEPVKSSLFVKHDLWNSLEDHNPNLLIGHCRWTSFVGGPEKVNKNNHPHVSKDFRVALVHNGKIPEYSYLKKKYDVTTECDSEVLLRIFESAEDHHDQVAYLRKELSKVWDSTPDSLLYRIFGLKKVFLEVTHGAMAVAIGERLEGDARSLFLFRNEHRPLCVIDLRKTLGQIFFCSTPEIFRSAVDASTIAKEIIPANQSVIPELLENWIYSIVLDKDNEFEVRRLKVNKIRKYGYWDQSVDEENIEIPKSSTKLIRFPTMEVISHLNASEELIPTATETEDIKSLLPVVAESLLGLSIPVGTEPSSTILKRKYAAKNKNSRHAGYEVEDDDDENETETDDVCGGGTHMRRESAVSSKILNNGFQTVKDWLNSDQADASAIAELVAELCSNAESAISEISTHVYNKVQEGSLTQSSVEDAYEGLKEVVNDLESIKCLLKL